MKKITISITPKGAEEAKPAIWYAGMANKKLKVKESGNYQDIYEVIDGKYKGKLIVKKDCKIL